MQYPVYPACRASLICDFFGLEHCGTWWEGLVGRSSGHQGLATPLLSSVMVLRLHSEANMHGCHGLPSRPVLFS